MTIDAIYEQTAELLRRLLKIEHSLFVIKEPAPSENYVLYCGDGGDRADGVHCLRAQGAAPVVDENFKPVCHQIRRGLFDGDPCNFTHVFPLVMAARITSISAVHVLLVDCTE
jgi:hypothetical protein